MARIPVGKLRFLTRPAGTIAEIAALSETEALSVVVVSDYAPEDGKPWQDERRILKALANQDLDKAFETILVESERVRHEVPEDLFELLPGLKIMFADSTRSTDLKRVGVEAAKGDVVAVFEADCVPNRPWLRVLVESLKRDRDLSAASGRTVYPDRGSVFRILTVLDRGYLDHGVRTGSLDVASNGAVFRRSVLMDFPNLDSDSPFVSWAKRVLAMRAAGHKFLFDPEALLVHALPGWGFAFDLRRNKGYEIMSLRDSPRYPSIPGLVFRRIRSSVYHAFRLGRKRFRWYDWPLAGLLCVFLPTLEVPGMIDAVRGARRPRGTRYR